MEEKEGRGLAGWVGGFRGAHQKIANEVEITFGFFAKGAGRGEEITSFFSDNSNLQ